MSKLTTTTENTSAAVQLLIDVLSQQAYSGQTKQFRRWIANYIKSNINGWKINVNNGNLYVTKGKASLYPCQVCHIDTVHKVDDSIEVHRQGDTLFAFNGRKGEQAGIGGDDKVGVFVCLYLLHVLPALKCVFFRDEETGCEGSKKALPEFFDDVAFVLQCDRRGSRDFINNISGAVIQSEDFMDAVKPIISSYGYSFAEGMMTDVEALKYAGIDLCMANMSCGYHEPHSDQEVVSIKQALTVTAMCRQLHNELADRRWEHVIQKPTRKTAWVGGLSDDSYFDWNTYKQKTKSSLNLYRSGTGRTIYDPKTSLWKGGGRTWLDCDIVWSNDARNWQLKEVSEHRPGFLLIGTGQYNDPIRWSVPVETIKSTNPADFPIANEDSMSEAERTVWEKRKQRPSMPDYCPLCGAGQHELQWDGFEQDYFCMCCTQYTAAI